MIEDNFIEVLPENFRHEKSFLIKNKLNNVQKLCHLNDSELYNIQKSCSLCTLNNLRKIRALAVFKNELSISPNESYLLLHCGIGSIRSLSNLNPFRIKTSFNVE